MDVKMKTDQGTAVVEGKTAVAFKAFVQLVLQRKVFGLFKDWGDKPIIVSSELLTSLASAPQDSQENREHLVMVTLATGVLLGVFLLAVVEIALTPWGIYLREGELLIIAGTLFGLALLVVIMGKLKRRSKGQKVAEAMEKIAGMLSK
ncbi:hypothetical protein FJZ28_00725 [Candidatus Peregrinibacteria bacterium]|nr:hypothetical protein [Candidatus Peregrinibacteria bacterium]